MNEKHAEYFEGILQLRDVDQTVYDWVYDTIERDGKATVAKEKIMKQGYDLYLSDQHYLQALGRKLNEKFPGELVVSMRLHSRDRMTHKAVYRVTVLFRAVPLHVGQVLTTDEGARLILRIGKNVQVQDLASGKKMMMTIDQAKKWIR
ncbi:hypothetical protein HY492_02365 [Candidatus Woesearchaeota archaeon]|nr:hypothetical protein [Candidatus Woesearchaeota archaeon]